MPELLIDDSGTVWPAEPAIIIRRFGLRHPRDFVFRAIDLGFIFVTLGECGVGIALRPQFVSRSACSRLFGIIGQRNPARLALAWDARLSSWELIVGGNRTIARIEKLIAGARSPSPRPLLTAQRLPLECSVDVGGGQLLPILEAWLQRQGRWEPELYGRLQERRLLAGTAIARQPRGSERLLIEHWGKNLTTYGKDWIRVAPGRDFEDQPNSEVGRWAGAMHRQTIAESVPRLTAADFVYRGIDGELVRLTCYRSDLPWRTSDGATIVTAITARRRMLTLDRPNPAN